MSGLNWVKEEITKYYGDIDLTKGIDFDANGVIENDEKIPVAKFNEASAWVKLVEANSGTLGQLGFFKHYFDHKEQFVPDNPIHDILAIDSERMSAQEIENVYTKVAKIVAEAKHQLENPPLSPRLMLTKIYQIIRESGLEIVKKAPPSFAQNILDGKIDCDSSALIVLISAFEMQSPWPLFPVRVPGHMFLRWDDGKGYVFNIDRGRIKSDAFYLSAYRIADESIKRGVYLTDNNWVDETEKPNLHEVVISNAYNNRGIEKYNQGDFAGAFADFKMSVEFDPHNVQAFNNQGLANAALGRHDDALGSYWWAIELDPNYAHAYKNLGETLSALNRHEAAHEQFTKARELSRPHVNHSRD